MRYAIAALLLISATLHAEDWPEFRGPHGTGIYAGKLPTEWGPATTNIAWKTPIPGKGWSSPILWKGKLYLTTALEGKKKDTYTLEALCVDAGTGHVDWQRTVFEDDGSLKDQIHKKNSRASPTAITDGERIYVHFGPWGTAALNFDGTVYWKQTELKFKPMHGAGGSPILAGDNLIVICDGTEQQYLAALDKKTGLPVWKTPRSIRPKLGFSFATPELIEYEGKQQIVAPGPDITAGYDPVTGKELWHVRYIGWSLCQRPTFANGLVYVSTGFMSPQLFAIKPTGSGDVTATNVVWKSKKAVSNTPSFLAVGDELYSVADRGFLTCYDAKTGTEHYSERLPGAYSASPLYADGKIYLTSEEGTGLIVPAGKEFKIAYRTEMKEKTFASFVPGDGAMYVRTEELLYKFK